MVLEVGDGQRRVIAHLATRAATGRSREPWPAMGIRWMRSRLARPPSGAVIAVKVAGVFRCVDGTDQDDKVVAISPASPLHAWVSTAAELEQIAPGAAAILHRWFEGYKPAGRISCSAMADEREAERLIAESQRAFVSWSCTWSVSGGGPDPLTGCLAPWYRRVGPSVSRCGWARSQRPWGWSWS